MPTTKAVSTEPEPEASAAKGPALLAGLAEVVLSAGQARLAEKAGARLISALSGCALQTAEKAMLPGGVDKIRTLVVREKVRPLVEIWHAAKASERGADPAALAVRFLGLLDEAT